MFRVLAGFLILMILPPVITFCNSENESGSEILNDSISDASHNSMNSLDWSGTYNGTTPCADCLGIETILTLKYDSTYELKTKYIGKREPLFSTSGSFSWNESGNQIRLQSGIQNRPDEYIVEENRLLQLDMNGKKITGQLKENYILEKVTD